MNSSANLNIKTDELNTRDNIKPGRLYDVVFIRAFAIVLVVAFHAYAKLYADHFLDMKAVYHDMYFNTNQLALKFRMPLFIFISGYLFSYLESVKGKYATFSGLLKNKFQRLIIPYFIFAIIYMLTTRSFNFEKLLSGDFTHLWFITMLFWCFIFTRLSSLVPYSKCIYYKVTMLFLSFALLFVPSFLPSIIGLSNSTLWFFWFYLGYFVLPYRELLYELIDKKYRWAILLVIGLLGTAYTVYYVKTDIVRTLGGQLGHLAIVLLVWYAVNRLIRNHPGKWLEGKFFKELNRTSYGIYVLHNWLQLFMISGTAKHIFHLNEIAQNHTVLFPLSFFLLSLLFSYIGSVMILKTKVGRFLIG